MPIIAPTIAPHRSEHIPRGVPPTSRRQPRLRRPSRLPTVMATTATRRFLDHLRWLLVRR
jgi:hypothetical protein